MDELRLMLHLMKALQHGWHFYQIEQKKIVAQKLADTISHKNNPSDTLMLPDGGKPIKLG